MATRLKDLSSYDLPADLNASTLRIGIVVSEWNGEITRNLLEGAREALAAAGVPESNTVTRFVPGSFELPLGAQFLLEETDADAVICLGAVIQGETRHFEFICNAVANGITRVGLDYNHPVVFGVLTTDDLQQARDRSGGKYGNKGIEAAVTAIKMAMLQQGLVRNS